MGIEFGRFNNPEPTMGGVVLRHHGSAVRVSADRAIVNIDTEGMPARKGFAEVAVTAEEDLVEVARRVASDPSDRTKIVWWTDEGAAASLRYTSLARRYDISRAALVVPVIPEIEFTPEAAPFGTFVVERRQRSDDGNSILTWYTAWHRQGADDPRQVATIPTVTDRRTCCQLTAIHLQHAEIDAYHALIQKAAVLMAGGPR